jgi:protein SCO1
VRLRADHVDQEQEPEPGPVTSGNGQAESNGVAPGGTGPGAPEAGAPEAGAPEAGARARAASWRLPVILGVVTVLLAAAIVTTAILVVRRSSGQAPRVSGIPANIPTSVANLMELSSVPSIKAPGFTFTDQNGHAVSLSSLRGKVVVLQFMDPHCTDICPIVSQEFVDAYHDLGPLASKVVFAAVNVNQYYRSVPSVAAFSNEHNLSSIPSWHFLTGPVPALKATWDDYNIDVQAPNPQADIVHTSAVYFIDAKGAERYLASPQVDHTSKGASYLPPDQLATWGRGIAAVARDIAR